MVDCNIPKYKIESISTIIKLSQKSVTFCVCVLENFNKDDWNKGGVKESTRIRGTPKF